MLLAQRGSSKFVMPRTPYAANVDSTVFTTEVYRRVDKWYNVDKHHKQPSHWPCDPLPRHCVWLSHDRSSVGAKYQGLVAAYAFEELAGTSVIDASGQGNTGTIQGATRVSGKYGSALSFNGTTDLVSIASSTSLSPTVGLTIEAWVFPTRAGGWQTAILKERPGGLVYGFYASDDAARPSGWVHTSSSDKSTPGTATLPLNVWTHIALTYNKSQLLLYVDGALVASSSVTGNVATSTGALRIGGNTIWGESFQGLIDEVRIYNRALGAAEIVTDLNTPVMPSTPDTEAPFASVTGPAPGTTVSGTVTVSATATDNIAVAGVQFTLNDANLGIEDTTSPFSIQWTTTGLAAGSYTLRARARDAAGNQGTSSGINVVVSAPPPDTMPPVVTISSPANGAAVSGPITLAAAASDNVGVVGVSFQDRRRRHWQRGYGSTVPDAVDTGSDRYALDLSRGS